jgi:hypothetical protein
MRAVTSATASLLSGNASRLSLLCNAAAGSLTNQALPAAAAAAAAAAATCTASRGTMQSILMQQQRLFATSGSSAGSDGPGELRKVSILHAES